MGAFALIHCLLDEVALPMTQSHSSIETPTNEKSPTKAQTTIDITNKIDVSVNEQIWAPLSSV